MDEKDYCYLIVYFVNGVKIFAQVVFRSQEGAITYAEWHKLDSWHLVQLEIR
jgi:hypothetical protein